MCSPIVLYTHLTCVECNLTKGALAARRIDFTERSAADFAQALAAKGFVTAPVLSIAVESELVVWEGHRPDLIALLADLLETGPVPTDGLSQITDAEDAVVTRMQVIEEIRGHQLNVDEFFRDCGNLPLYRGKVLLNWLGY